MTSGITDPTEAYFKDGTWGWDGTVWRKLPLIFGYSDRYAEAVDDDDADAGTNSLESTAVPSGYIYVIQVLSAFNANSVCSAITLFLKASTVEYRMYQILTPPANAPAVLTGAFVLKEGDKTLARFTGCLALDDLKLRVWGYKMKIAE